MADYDLSKPAPDRTRFDEGSGAGGYGFILVGLVVVLVVLYAVFGGAGLPPQDDAGRVIAPDVAPIAAPVAGE